MSDTTQEELESLVSTIVKLTQLANKVRPHSLIFRFLKLPRAIAYSK